MNLFAERYTDRSLLGWSFPAGILQGATALYTILLAPVFAALWIALGNRGKDLSPPAKFATETTKTNNDRDQIMRIKIGDENRTVSGQDATYVITYDVRGALRHFADAELVLLEL